MQNIDLNKKLYCCSANMKMENSGLKKVSIKNRTCYYFDDIITFKDFDSDNTFMDEKQYENIFCFSIFHTKL